MCKKQLVCAAVPNMRWQVTYTAYNKMHQPPCHFQCPTVTVHYSAVNSTQYTDISLVWCPNLFQCSAQSCCQFNSQPSPASVSFTLCAPSPVRPIIYYSPSIHHTANSTAGESVLLDPSPDHLSTFMAPRNLIPENEVQKNWTARKALLCL
jgi:hypothetical protein